MDGYKISSELFLYLLSNLKFYFSTSSRTLGYHEVVFDDISLIKEVTLWVNVIRGSQFITSIKVDIGPFYGVFPFSLEFSETHFDKKATVDFSIDFCDGSRGITWKDWFILEEDKYRMEVTRN